ncbi:MAG: NAD(P)/FAD-dependent oxidoreductase, partial [Bacilli bacterium]|nr:NAD(P)/FAD-dependent oxidoreductase [Bacilli bacterium]
GVKCVQHILEENSIAFDISIFGSEGHPNYSRIMLSSVLQGETSFEDIVINTHSWYENNGIRLFAGETVVEIDQDHKLIKTDKNREVPYDKLIIATGSTPFILPIEGADKEGVISFRTIEDCEKMIKTAEKYSRAVVIGGGLLGLEAARGLLNLGMEVYVVHNSNYIMERQLDPEASSMLRHQLEQQGMNFLLEKETEKIIGKKRVEGICFKDGSKVDVDIVVMAAGVRPNVQLAKISGIDTNRGIIVNDFLQTKCPDIYAVGECAEHDGIVYGLVQPLYEQGKVLAQHLCQKKTSGYHGSVLSTQLKIAGVDVFSVGQFTSEPETRAIRFHN